MRIIFYKNISCNQLNLASCEVNLSKKWSGENLTNRTGGAAPAANMNAVVLVMM